MRAPKDRRKSRERPGRIIIKQVGNDASKMRTSALQPVRNEMRGVSKNLCGKARVYNLLLLLHLHHLLSVSPWTSVVNSTQLMSNCPAELPSSHLTSPPQPILSHTRTQLTPHSDFRSRFRYRKRCFSVEHLTRSSCSCSRVYLGRVLPFLSPFAPLCEPPFVPPREPVASPAFRA